MMGSGGRSKILGLCLLLVVCPVSGGQFEQEIDDYIRVYQDGSQERIEIANDKLRWSGVGDERLFDTVAARLGYEKNKKVVLALIETISYSGNIKYESDLRDLMDRIRNRSVRKSADQAFLTLANYRRWNPIISNGLESVAPGRVEAKRIINMITLMEPDLEWLAGRVAFEEFAYDDEVVAAARETLKSGYNKNTTNGTHIDAMAYLIKVLIGSGDVSHIPLFEEIYSKAQHKKMKRYAEDALERFGVHMN